MTRKVLIMSLRRTADGTTKPRGFYLPELPRPEYFALKDLQQALDASNWEVINVLIRLGAGAWQRPEGQQRLRELLATFRQQAPSEAHLPAILP
jgi:hypothetical protein